MRLKNQVVIVTGAARGIGQEACLALAREGARVVAADIAPCGETVSKVEAAGAEALAVSVDVASDESARAMAGEVRAKLGRIDALVNNAALYGGLRFTPFEHIQEAEWDRVMAVNVKGAWQCAKAVIPAMREQGRGKIVNVSSSTIWIGAPMLLHYVASKGAIVALTRALARELSGSGIHVNAVSPGFTMTEASRDLAPPEVFAAMKQQIVDMQIIKRSEEPADLTGALVFLCSAESDFITGQTLNVDGGLAHH